jgi:uncharacterized membrane protein
MTAMEPQIVTKPLARAGIFLGIGLGGFVDGILFHQILQTHAMLSARLPKTSVENIQINMFWDGMFHAFTWAITLIGLTLLWRAQFVRNILMSGRVFVGSLFVGWGLFNVVEGVIDHHVLHLHHVVEAKGESVFDYLFLIASVVFIAAGWIAIRNGRNAPSRARA